jgi:predicted nucleic acid-binding Zn ribbon protein
MAYWKQPQSIGAALALYMKESGLEHRVDEARVLEMWREIAGEAIHAVTREIRIYNGILYVHLWSAAWRSALYQQRFEWRNKLNEALGKDLVQDIVFR